MYKVLGFLKMLLLLLQKGKVYLLLLILSIFVFSSFVVVILGIRNAVSKAVDESVGSKLPPDIIKVTPKIIPRNIFSGDIKGSEIVLKDYYKISKIKGVKKVYRVMEVPFPSSVILNVFGIIGRSDMITYGVDYELVKKDIFKGFYFSYTNGQKIIPFVVPKGIIEGYNLAFSRGQGTPSVNEKILKGLRFKFFAGKSSFRTLSKFIELEGEIVGISDRIPPLSICMPIEAASYLSRELVTNYRPSYSMLYVEVKSHEFVNDVIDRIRKMGFVIETSVDKTVFVENVKGFISYIILGLIALVGVFAVISVFISTALFVTTKVEFLSLLRLLGANKFYISFLITFLMSFIVLSFSLISSFFTQSVFVNYASTLLDKYDVLSTFIKKEFFYLTLLDVFIPIIVSTFLAIISSIFVSVRFFTKNV